MGPTVRDAVETVVALIAAAILGFLALLMILVARDQQTFGKSPTGSYAMSAFFVCAAVGVLVALVVTLRRRAAGSSPGSPPRTRPG